MATTPVVMKVQDYKDREVQMVSYEFDQETDREGQMTGIPRFQMLRVRVKALNDGTPELMAWMCRNRGASNTFFATWQTVFSAKDKIFSLDNNKRAALRQLFYSV